MNDNDSFIKKYQKVKRTWPVRKILVYIHYIRIFIVFCFMVPRLWYSAIFYMLGNQLPSSSCVIERDIRYSRRRPSNTMDVYVPDLREATKNNPVLVFVHGSGWSSGFKSFYVCIGRRLSLHGITVFIANYTLYPTGKIEQQVEDMDELVKYVRTNAHKYRGSVENISLMGHGAGAHILAQYLATIYDPAVARVTNFIGIAGIYDIPSHFLHQASRGMELESYMSKCCNWPDGLKKASPAYSLLESTSKELPSMYFQHGNRDNVVPIDESIKFCQLIKENFNCHTQVLEYDEVNHEDIIIEIQDQDTANPMCSPFELIRGSRLKRHRLIQLYDIIQIVCGISNYDHNE